jgi:hypothetical protein
LKLRAVVPLALFVAVLDAHDADPVRPDTFRDPAVVASRDGVLKLTGRPVLAAAYNGCCVLSARGRRLRRHAGT